eukprot:7101268-Alexandrium_andersonii.AAC.1
MGQRRASRTCPDASHSGAGRGADESREHCGAAGAQSRGAVTGGLRLHAVWAHGPALEGGEARGATLGAHRGLQRG